MATKKNKQYWARRIKQMQDAIKDGAYKDAKAIEREYNAAIKDIDTKIRAWYQRLADNNSISYADAVKLLKKDELEEFHWTVQQYIDRGSGVVSGDWEKQLENASARVHISRLDALKTELQAHAEELTGKQIVLTENAAKTAFSESYYHTAYEMQQLAGVGVSMQKIDRRQLEKVLTKPWTTDGKTFSDRIWGGKDNLVNTIGKELTRMVATGAKPDTAIKNISHALEVSRENAARLVMTESAFFASAAQKECFNDLNVERYEVVGTFDSRMCDYCGEMNGKVFPMKDFKEGTTAPPFHPWCRCTTAPYFEDMKDVGERWMRDPETGKGGTVPADMTYQEWKAKYVDNSGESGIINTKRLTKLKEDGSIANPMDADRYLRMKKQLEKRGCSVVSAKGDDERWLMLINAEAIADEVGIIHLGDLPSASAFFEETIHFTQIKKYGALKETDFVERAAREVAANRKMLKHGKEYGFTAEDYADIKNNLSYWERDFLERAGISYDESKIHREV